MPSCAEVWVTLDPSARAALALTAGGGLGHSGAPSTAVGTSFSKRDKAPVLVKGPLSPVRKVSLA